MPKSVVSTRIIIPVIVLLAGLWVGSDKSSVSSWIQIIGICAGFFYICSLITSQTRGHSSWALVWAILIAGIIILIWFSQNQIVAIYLIGCVFLACYFVFSHVDSTESSAALLSPLSATAIIATSITVVLLASPVTVGRIIVSLAALPVPSEFELHSDPGARKSYRASQGYPSHSLHPIDVHLNANNVQIDEPMPWLELQARRDTNFTIEQIQYNFLHTTLYQLKFDELHQITLSEKSDDVTLSKINNGIQIEEIGKGESAWLKLPDLDGKPLEPGAILKSAGIKVFIWALICFAFFVWAPRISRHDS